LFWQWGVYGGGGEKLWKIVEIHYETENGGKFAYHEIVN
jgi:hypothetical protein